MSKTIPAQGLAIFVSLDIGGRPPVTVDPATFSVEDGPMEIQWVRAENSQHFRFPHDALELHGDPKDFSNPHPLDHHLIFSVLDKFTTKGKFTYTLKVEHDGKTYTSKIKNPGEGNGDPVIHNK